MNSKQARPPYRGTKRGFVIAIDVGTTFSGTSWALLEPRQIPEIWDVSGFEGQEFQAGSTKVPTIIYYDTLGNVQAIGSETLDPDKLVDFQEDEWIKSEWFKLLLRPDQRVDSLEGVPKISLPPGKTVAQVFGDFLKYMAELARDHFLEKMVDAKSIWKEVEGRVQYVLSHPNGWNTFQHQHLRDAAVFGSLVTDSEDAKSRVTFVSEGEASLHWCMSLGLGPKAFEAGSNIVVVDAGGGTIDVSSFSITTSTPLQLEERFAADCHLAGSVFVTGTFKKFVEKKLGSGSKYNYPEIINRLVDDFDKSSKCTFRRKDRKVAVAFGSSRENENKYDIMSGRLVLQGHEIADCFEPSCTIAAKALRAHVAPGGRTTVFMVGGFSGSPWLFSELQRQVADLNVDIIRPENSTAKAAANGSVCFYLDHLVKARVAKYTYGVPCSPSFIASDPSHIQRIKDVFANPLSGEKFVSGGFETHLLKGTVVRETEVTRVAFTEESQTRQPIAVDLEFSCYKGDNQHIEWTDEADEHSFRTLCHVRGTIPVSCLTLRSRGGSRGKRGRKKQQYWQAEFDVVVSFGTTEFQCYIEWSDRQGNRQRCSTPFSLDRQTPAVLHHYRNRDSLPLLLHFDPDAKEFWGRPEAINTGSFEVKIVEHTSSLENFKILTDEGPVR